VVARNLSAVVCTSIAAWLFCPWRPSHPSVKAPVRGMILFGMHSLGSYFMNYASRNADKLLLGLTQGTLGLGLYDRAYRLFVLPVNQVSYPLTSVAVATLRRLRTDHTQFCLSYARVLGLTAFLGMGISAIVTVGGHDLVLAILGPKWMGAESVLVAFGPGVGMMLVYGTHGWLHLALGRADRWFGWSFVAAIVTIGCFVAGLPYGAPGVAAGYTISFYLLAIPGLWFAGKPVKLRVKLIVNAVWPYLIAGALAGLATVQLDHAIARPLNLSHYPAGLRVLLTSMLCGFFYIIFSCSIHRSFAPLRTIWRIYLRLNTRQADIS
jgi:PST family polysaccharide transporter